MKCGLCSKKKTRDALPSALPPVKLATPPIRNNDNPAIKTLPNGLQKDTSKTSLTAAEPTYENLDDPELWARAYTSLKTRQEQLVQEFEQYVKSLSSSDNSTPTGDDANERPFDAALVEEVYEKRKKELEDGQWGVKFHGQKVVVRKQVERLFRFAIWSDKIITPALSAQPAAAMAWSAVSIALPLLLNSTQQDEKMLAGYNAACNYQRLYKFRIENHQPLPPAVARPVIDFYSKILEYQACVVCFLAKGSFKQYIRGTAMADDWAGLGTALTVAHDLCSSYMNDDSKRKAQESYDNQSRLMAESVEVQKQIAAGISDMRADIALNRQDDNEKGLLRDLFSDYKRYKDFNPERVPGTCEWFLKDQKFTSWREDPRSRLFWLSAGPGSGKSTLCKSLIDEQKLGIDLTTTTVCYFFFKDNQSGQRNSADALSAILHQLFDQPQNASLIHHGVKAHRSRGKKLKESFQEMWDVLVSASCDSGAGKIVCVLDALDECEQDSRKEILEKLTHFYEQSDLASTLSFFVTSRPYLDLQRQFSRLSGHASYVAFDGEDKARDIAEDINLVIDTVVPIITLDWKQEDREELRRRLKAKESRTYLWLHLTLNLVEKNPEQYFNMKETSELFDQLPADVSDAYEKMLERSHNKKLARPLLEAVLFAPEPFTVEEFAVVLALAPSDSECSTLTALKNALLPSAAFRKTVENLCGLLISVFDNKIFLIHQTAREFLLADVEVGKKPDSTKWAESFPPWQCNVTMARICLRYLAIWETEAPKDYKDMRLQKEEHGEDSKWWTQPEELFLPYASLNWADHYYRGLYEESPLDALALKICQAHGRSLSSAGHPSWWFHIYYRRRLLLPGRFRGSYLRFDGKATDIIVAAGVDCLEVLKMLLSEHTLTAADAPALQFATHANHVCVSLLLEHGIHTHMSEDELSYSLVELVMSEQDLTLRNLVQTHASLSPADRRAFSDPEVQQGEKTFVNALGRALIPAAIKMRNKRFKFETYKLLLDSGANFHAVGPPMNNPGPLFENTGWTPLSMAAWEGQTDLIQLLLDHGADINFEGGGPWTNAIAAAAAESQIDTLRYLLEKGADPNRGRGVFGPPLALATQRNQVESVRLLVDHGANLDSMGGGAKSFIEWAEKDRSKEILELLRGILGKGQGPVGPEWKALLVR